MWTSGPDTVRVTRFEAVAGGFLLSFAASNGNDFSMAVATVKALSVREREWRPDDYAWWISAYAVSELINTFPPLRRYLEHGSHGGQSSGTRQQHSHGYSPQGPAPIPAEVARAFGGLCLTPQAPPELVKAARRTLARLFHPDAGGDVEDMKRINKSADLCEEWLDKHAPA